MKFTTYLRSAAFQIVVVFLLALSIRTAYLLEIRDNPFFKYLTLDQTSYDHWARSIARGNWLGKEIFYQDPLYPYFLGSLYTLIGRDLFWVRAVQVLIGSLTCALICWLGMFFSNRRAGLLAGLMAAFYLPFIYFDAMILKTFLAVFLTSVFLVVLVAARPRRSFLLWVAAGLVLGLLSLVRANALGLAAGVLAWLFLVDREQEKLSYKTTASAGFLVGLFLLISLVCVRNYIVGKDFVVLTSQAGQNFYIGNNELNISGRYHPPHFIRPNPSHEQEDFRVRAEIAAGRTLKPSEISSYWFGEAFKFIKEQPAQWLKLTGKKFWRFWNWYEVPDNQNYYFFSRYSRIQRLPLPNFQVVAALALAGMLFFLPQWRRLFLLYMTVLIYSGTVIVFYIFDRYRLPVVPPLILFAAFFLCEALTWGRHRKWVKIAAAALLFVFLFALLGTDVNKDDYYGDSANAYCRLATFYERQRNWEPALLAYRQAVDIMPHYWASHYGLGNMYSRLQKPDLALQSYLQARMYNPENPNICVRIGFLYYQRGEFEKSIKFYQFAAQLKPDWNRPYYWLAVIYKTQGNQEMAEVYTKKLRELQVSGKGVL